MGSGAPFSLRVCFVDPLRKVCRVEIVRSIREYPVHPMLRIVWLALLAACSSYADERPNIVLIVVDDMGYGDLGCYGSEIPTPHIDSLAENGLRFRQFYNTAKCWTTRASLLTGLYYQQVTDQKQLDRNGITIAAALKASGYRTTLSGKWHLSGGTFDKRSNQPLSHGFDEFYGTLHGAGSFYDPFTLQEGFAPVEAREDFYYTDAITDHAVERLRIASDEGKPFFHYVAYTAPHWPMQAPAAEIEKYKRLYREGWDALREQRFAKQVELGVADPRWSIGPRNPGVPAWEDAEDREWEIHRMATYAAMLNIVDRGIGRITAQLKKQAAFDNTLILFMSDNGGSHEEIGFANGVSCLGGSPTTRRGAPIQVGRDPNVLPGPEETFQGVGPGWANVNNTPFRMHKVWSHEGGIATPMIAHWPEGIAQRGAITDEVAHVIDVMATCLDITGTSYPSEYKGRRLLPQEGLSLRRVFDNGSLPERALFWDYANKAAVRLGKWKLLAPSTKNLNWELYEMEADRGERNDLASRYPEKTSELAARYQAWKLHIGPDRNKPIRN